MLKTVISHLQTNLRITVKSSFLKLPQKTKVGLINWELKKLGEGGGGGNCSAQLSEAIVMVKQIQEKPILIHVIKRFRKLRVQEIRPGFYCILLSFGENNVKQSAYQNTHTSTPDCITNQLVNFNCGKYCKYYFKSYLECE